jgi:hypothetical protein
MQKHSRKLQNQAWQTYWKKTMRWGGSMKWLAALAFCLLPGCVYAPLPELPKFPAVEQIEPKTEAENGTQRETAAIAKHPQPRDSPIAKTDAEPQCPSLPMPEPIPKTLYIEIGKDSDKADENGIRLLENYKELRKEIKKQWHSKPP